MKSIDKNVDSDKYEDGEEVVAADKVDAQEATEELSENGQESSVQHAACSNQQSRRLEQLTRLGWTYSRS